VRFSAVFSHHFKLKTRDVGEMARQYMCGLVQADKKNIERIEEAVPECDYHALQHFITDSPWDHRAVMDQVATEADKILGGSSDSCLLIDETAFEKKGTKSVGVARQWNGRLGKVDNCQVAVFAALAQRERITPIDTRLYLPKEWTDDPARCRAAKVPRIETVFRRKADLALEMVSHARSLGVRFNWVGADGFYGNDPAFCRGLEDMGETFCVDVHSDQRVYLEDPQPYVPSWRGHGRRPRKRRTDSAPIRVDQWVASQPADLWRTVTTRDSTKGKLRVAALSRRVWLWDGKEETARSWILIARRDGQTQSNHKYSLTNQPEDTPLETLVCMQGQRYWVERAFEDAKGEAGMADYQVRGWFGWHHHMALVMMALLFMAGERLLHKDTVPLLSCADIEELLSQFLPRRKVDADEVLRQMTVRHQKRQASIALAYSKQGFQPPG